MHERHAKDGVVCISVSTDEKEQQAEVVKYLKAQKASFPNFLLDEEPEVWQEKLKMIAPPAVFVCDREGAMAEKFANDERDTEFTYEDVEKLVKKLLAK